MNKNELWQKILHIAITILTAIATTFGVTSCRGMSRKRKRCTGSPDTPLDVIIGFPYQNGMFRCCCS